MDLINLVATGKGVMLEAQVLLEETLARVRVRPGELKPWGFQLATNKVISVAAARAIFARRDKQGKGLTCYPSTTMYNGPSIPLIAT